MIIEKSTHPQGEKFWCGLWAGGIIGALFFQNEIRQAVTVNGVRYREMIPNLLWPELKGWMFQQDGATLKEFFSFLGDEI